MVLNVFRKNQFIRSVLLLPLTMLLNADLFLMEAPMSPIIHNRIDTWLHWIQVDYPILHWIGYSVVLFLTAVILNRMVIIHRLSNKPTLLPGLFLIVLMSIWPSISGLSSLVLTLPLLLLLISNLLYAYEESRQVGRLFNVGLYSGVLVLIAAPYVWVLIPILMSLSILTSIKWRSVLNVFNGMFLAPFFVVLYDTIQLDAPLRLWHGWMNQVDWAVYVPLSGKQDWLILTGLILLFLYIVLSYAATTSRKGIHVIRKIASMTWFMLLAVILYMAFGARSFHPSIIMFPIGAYFISEGVLRFKNPASAEFVLMLLLILSGVLPFV